LKEIKQVQTESVWDYDQRFKDVMGRLTFHIPNQQHREWFIARLLPHIRYPLIQPNVLSQPEALEIAMKLEASSVGDGSSLDTVSFLDNPISRIDERKGEAGTSLVCQV
jgi:hypothetical protein